MTYKYSENVNSIEGCPPADYLSQDLIVYRWVHENMSHHNDFLPVALINPKRVNGPNIDLVKKCQGYGLSLFNTIANARKQYKKRVANHPKLVGNLGEYIAEGRLSKTDGVISPVHPRTGHITLHEFADVDLKEKFEIKGAAIYDG